MATEEEKFFVDLYTCCVTGGTPTYLVCLRSVVDGRILDVTPASNVRKWDGRPVIATDHILKRFRMVGWNDVAVFLI